MARRVAISNLNARTIDILNTIRANASYEYQSLVPEVTTEQEVVKVGDVLFGYPALANQFLNALVNRIALVKVKSAVFNNAYAELKKGYLEFGETVEEVFVGIAKAREFSAEKAEARELKRSIPDVRSAFHTMNWRVQYPVTIQQEDLRMAFTNIGGVQDLIAKIVDAVYTAAEYDEYLLFKYLIIKAVTHGKMYPVSFDGSDIKNAAKKFRGMSNQLTFMSNKFNASGVTTSTPKENQYIFMDSLFNADYDVDVLASAFNMDKADFMGKLKLIDDFTTFDNERFAVIRGNSDMIEEVTDSELALMADVKGVLVDDEWFQVYDNTNQFTEKYVASGMYWNYFYNVWKTVSSSPFSNAIVFIDSSSSNAENDTTITAEVVNKSVGENGTVIVIEPQSDSATLSAQNFEFIQNEDCTEEGVAVHKYGAIMYPANANAVPLSFKVGDDVYTSSSVATTVDVGDTITFTKNGSAIANDIKFSDEVTVNPNFSSDVIEYTGTSTADSVSAEIELPVGTSVVVKQDDETIEPEDDGSYEFTLVGGATGNEITFKVTGTDSTTKTYTFDITYS